MNVLKLFGFCKFPLAVLCAALPISTYASELATDFASRSQSIEQYQTDLEELEREVGYFSYELIEPLQQLISAQLSVNRLDTAEEFVDRAMQITRIEDGLYTALQYPFLQQAIEIEMTRGDWEEVNEKIRHYTFLIGEHYQGNAPDRLQRMRWIATVHLRGSDEDSKGNKASHLIQVTSMNELAVQYAQLNRIANDETYGELLLELAEAYRLEAQNIRGGGSTSYRLRRLFADLDIIEDKKEAIYKRYMVGLEKLQMYRDLMFELYPDNGIISAECALLIADWYAGFGKKKLAEEFYQRAQSVLDSSTIVHSAHLPVFTSDGESVSAD
ncbi:MAG: hypothetical protein MI746_18135 [Pseudomonadales bacterium]|nr:hypothetical protein [Pseudomonadales bacterium]